MRLGEEFRDLEDVRYLLRYLNVSTVPNAVITSREAAKQSTVEPKRRLLRTDHFLAND